MINWQRTTELAEEVGPESFDEVFDLFIDEVEDALTRLTATDIEMLRKQMHFLKGSALNLGFRAVANLCQSAESDVDLKSVANQRIVETRALFQKSKSLFLEEKADKLKLS